MKRNELLFETEKRSDCYDRRETRCKRLEDVRNNARECREYFTSTECMSGLPKDDKPNCITLFTNYCEEWYIYEHKKSSRIRIFLDSY